MGEKNAGIRVAAGALAAFMAVAGVGYYVWHELLPAISKSVSKIGEHRRYTECGAFLTTDEGAKAEREAWQNAPFGATEVVIKNQRGDDCKLTR